MSASTCKPARQAFRLWLVRGGIGLVLLVVAGSTRHPIVAVPALLVALVAFGGCPMCWLFGLLERRSQELPSAAPGRHHD